MRFSPGLIACLLLLSQMSCRSLRSTEQDNYGLPLVSLHLNPEDLGQLSNQSMSKRPVPARITIRPDLDTPGEIAFAGRSSLDAYRKSLQLEFGQGLYRERSRSRLSAQLMDTSMLRSMLAAEVFQVLQVPVSELEWVSAYLNLRFLGLYLLIENVDTSFFQRRSLPIRELYKAKFGNAAFRVAELSQLSESFTEEAGLDRDVFLRELYVRIWDDANELSLRERISPLLDVDLFLRYMAAAVFMDHFDGFSNNYYLAFDSKRKLLLTIPWDFDRVWEKTSEQEPQNLVELNQLLSKLLQEDESRQRFILFLEQLLTQFSDEYCEQRIQSFQTRIAAAHSADPVLQRVPLTERSQELTRNLRLWRTKLQRYLESLKATTR